MGGGFRKMEGEGSASLEVGDDGLVAVWVRALADG